jgi:hypothetical protein
MLDADFVCVGPAGFVLTKEQYLAPRRSHALRAQAFAWEDVRARVYGDTAVVVGTQIQESAFEGRDASGRFRATKVLVRRGGDWAIVGLHLSPITPAPGWLLGVLQAGTVR